jgi:hypothetical protein
VNNELKEMWKELSWYNLGLYPRIYLEGLRKTMKKLSHYNQSIGCEISTRRAGAKEPYIPPVSEGHIKMSETA